MCQSYCRYFQSAIRFYFSRFNTYKLSLNFSLGVNKSFFNFNIRSSKAHTQVYLCFNQIFPSNLILNKYLMMNKNAITIKVD